MIEVSRLRAVKRIITHANCADGTTSAMILRHALPGVPIEFVQYGSDARELMVAEPGMLFCDMSPPESRADEFLAVEAIVLDHHAKCKDTILRFVERGLGVFGDEVKNPGVGGAVLAYRHVWSPLTVVDAFSYRASDGVVVEDLATLAGIRDTWQTQHPRWIEAQQQAAAVKFWGNARLVGSAPDSWASLVTMVGERAYEQNLEGAQQCLEGATTFETDRGLRVAVFQGVRPTSDAAEMLRGRPELVGGVVDVLAGFALFSEHGRMKLVFSLRSLDSYDVGAFCKAMGGGGHTKAAGFNASVGMESANPVAVLRDLFNSYEVR